MSDPVLIEGAPDAVLILRDIIRDGTTPTPVPGQNIFMSYRVANPDDQGFVYLVLNVPGSGDPEFTMGTIVALEHSRVDVIIYGNTQDLNGPRMEAMRVRYLIASKGDFVSNGLRMLSARPVGNVEYLGPDALQRSQFMVSFDVTTDPSYVVEN